MTLLRRTATVVALIAVSLGGCSEGVTGGLPAQTVAAPSAAATSTMEGGSTTAVQVVSSPTVVTSTTRSHQARYVSVQYRSDPVDVANPAFEYLSTAGSSLVTSAWYDRANGYTIIGLNGTYYHYCNLPLVVWSGFRAASSFGSYYNASIKGRYGCEGRDLPDY